MIQMKDDNGRNSTDFYKSFKGTLGRSSKFWSAFCLLHGVRISVHDCSLDVLKGSRQIRLSRDHLPYLRDLGPYFDAYFHATRPPDEQEPHVRDYSGIRDWQYEVWPDGPITTPSLPEFSETIDQYIQVLKPQQGEIGLDLGAYSGLVSLAFRRAVGESGRVVAVEADETSLSCCSDNFSRYRSDVGNVDLLHAAVWSSDGEVNFSAEGSLGSAVGLGRNKHLDDVVPSMTLSSIVTWFGLERVDFVKADIEGAETEMLKDRAFFESFKPRIVMELPDSSRRTLRRYRSIMQDYGYETFKVSQANCRLNLLVGLPG